MYGNISKKQLIIASAAVLAAVMAVLAVFIAVNSGRKDTNPVENTLKAVLGLEDSVFASDDINRIKIDASVGSDIIPALNRNTQDLSLSAGRSTDGKLVLVPEIKVGSTSRTGLLSLDRETGDVTAEAELLGGSYSFNRKTLKEQLDRSVFAPGSGSKYALDEEIYDMLISFAGDDGESESYGDEIKDGIITPTLESIKKNLTSETSDGVFKALDSEKEIKVSVIKITGSNAIFDGLADTLAELWRDNDMYYELVCSLYSGLSADEINNEYDSFVAGLREFADKAEISLDMNIYIKGKYMIGADGSFTAKEKGESEAQNLTFTLEFAEKPSDNPSFEFECSGRLNGSDHKISLSYSGVSGKARKKASGTTDKLVYNRTEESEISGDGVTYYNGYVNSFTFEGTEPEYFATYSAKYYVSEGVRDPEKTMTDFSGEISGEYKADGSYFSVKKFTFKSGDEEKVYDKSSLEFSCLKDKIECSTAASEALAIDKLTEEKLDEIINGLSDKADTLAADMNEALDAELFTKNGTVSTTAAYTIGSSDYLACYDRSTDRLFLLARQSFSADLTVLDGTTMEVLGEKHFSTAIRAMDADNGHFAYAQGNELKIYFLDENTLEQTDVRTFDDSIYYIPQNDYVKNLVIDGDTLIATKADQWCSILMIDISTWTYKTLTTLYSPWLKLDKEKHILAAAQSGLTKNMLGIYNSLTGEDITGINTTEMRPAAPYLCGNAVLWDGRYVSFETKQTALISKLCPEIPYKNNYTTAALVYSTDLITVTLEMARDGSVIYTAFYDKHGNNVCNMEKCIADTVAGKNGTLYAVTIPDTNSAEFTRYAFGEEYALNIG